MNMIRCFFIQSNFTLFKLAFVWDVNIIKNWSWPYQEHVLVIINDDDDDNDNNDNN